MGTNYNPRIVTNGLVLCLDAANPKSYPGSGTTWTDLSGRGNNGTLTNGPTFSGANGGSLVFDGANDYISLPSIVLDKPFTLDFFCSVNQNKNQGFYVSRTVLAKGISVFALGAAGSNTIRFDTGDEQWTTSYVVPLSVLVNLTLSVDSTSKNLFVNGNLHSSTPFTGTINSVSSTLATIGCSNIDGGSFDNRVNGKIPLFKVYNRALSAAEIQQNFNATRGRYGI